MNKKSSILIIIPARGGSKGIPRKNLRTLNGYPLIYYAIKTSLNSKFKPDVYVTSEDDEILAFAKKFGAKTHKREDLFATDETTLDPVIYSVYKHLGNSKKYKFVITVQPTSPLLSTKSLDAAISMILANTKIDSIISASDDTHLTWRYSRDKFIPNYKKRLNRQKLAPIYKETGGFLISKSKFIKPNSRIGENIELFLLNSFEKIDIDDTLDWNICEYLLKRKNILMVVTGHNKVGTGHIHNLLSIANDILNHNIVFLVDDKSDLAYHVIKENNYTVYKQESSNLLRDIVEIDPDIVINDILDTTADYVKSLKKKGYLVINFEDLGSGARYADLVINAMYPEKSKYPNHYYGAKYFCLKNDFLFTQPKIRISKAVKSVLITFGGTDPNNYTKKVLDSIYDHCEEQKIIMMVIVGLGYEKHSSLNRFKNIQIHNHTPNLADIMKLADIIFTSAGRTAFEIASLGIPAIVLCQNSREKSHFFANSKNGFINLGEKSKINSQVILSNFTRLARNMDQRKRMHEKMLSTDCRNGKTRVIKLIQSTINKHFK